MNFKLWKTKIRILDKNTKLGFWTTKLIVYIGEKDPKQWASICIDLLICWKLKQMDNFKQIGWKCLFLWQFISYRHYFFIVGKIKCCVGKFGFCHFRQSISSSGSKHCWIYQPKFYQFLKIAKSFPGHLGDSQVFIMPSKMLLWYFQ